MPVAFGRLTGASPSRCRTPFVTLTSLSKVTVTFGPTEGTVEPSAGLTETRCGGTAPGPDAPIDQVKSVAGPTLPTASVARTEKMWTPIGSASSVSGLAQPAKPAPSTSH